MMSLQLRFIPFLLVFTLAVGVSSATGGPDSAGRSPGDDWYQTDPLARELSQLNEPERNLYQNTHLLSVRPVAIPREKEVVSENNYYDWPIACRVKDTIIVLFDRRRYHFGGDGPRTNGQSGIRMVTRSVDGGRSWSQPVDVIDQAGTWSKTLFDGWGGGLGVHEGMVYLALNEGVYRSKDNGKTWQLVTDEPNFSGVPHEPTKVRAYGEGATQSSGAARTAAPFWSPGMRLTFHEKHGLTIWSTRGFKKEGRDGKTNSHYGEFLCALSSPDFGKTWQFEEQPLPDGLFLNEITPLQFDGGKVAFFVRNGIRDSKYGQAFSATGWFPFEFDVTNVGPVRTTDTPDVIYNPETQRLEAAVSFRQGDRPLEMRLYSIDAEKLAAGTSEWRFDGVLVRYRSRFGRSDGMNPVGGVVDRQAGMHRIYIWGGDAKNQAGIFQYSRSLETDRVRAYLRNAREGGDRNGSDR